MKSIALVSGGLDSLVSLAVANKETDIILALTFDYGQKSAKSEISAARKICSHYRVPLKVIRLDWLSKITSTALVNRKVQVPEISEGSLDGLQEITLDSAKAVWVPNRNGLFVNIAAAFAEALGADQIVAGFNSEEALTFPDNSLQFVNSVNAALKLSTLAKPKVVSYVQSFNKSGIITQGALLDVPFHLIYSCYNSGTKMCGRCESCARIKKAFKEAGRWESVRKRFRKDAVKVHR